MQQLADSTMTRTCSLPAQVCPEQTQFPLGVFFAMDTQWAQPQHNDLRWGFNGPNYDVQGCQNLNHTSMMWAPLQEGPAQGKQTNVCASKGGSGQKAKRQQLVEPTTVFFRNVPNNCTGKMILELLDSSGLDGKYDFVYAPHDFKRLPQLVTLGYFFANFISHDIATKALEKLVGFSEWTTLWSQFESTKVLDASWAAQTQGKSACIRRYKNCPVMHETVPPECKPMVFEDGVMVTLSPPNKKVKQPRFKKGYMSDDKLEDGVDIVDEPEKEPVANEQSLSSNDSDSPANKENDGEIPSYDSTGPFWMPDESACGCSKCDETFTMFRRRHHCRACGLICCAECAPRTISTACASLLKRSNVPIFKRLCKDCVGSQANAALRAPMLVKNTFIDVQETTFGSIFASRISQSDSF